MPASRGGCPGSQPRCVQPYLGRKRVPAEGGIGAELIVCRSPGSGTAQPGCSCKHPGKCLSPPLSFALFVGESRGEREVFWCCVVTGGSWEISIKRQSLCWASRALPWQPCAGPDLFQTENTDLNPSLLGVEGTRKPLDLLLSALIFLSRALVCP